MNGSRILGGADLASVPREIAAGVTTFLTMAYILVVQPTVLSTDFAGAPTGLEAGAVLLATCCASAGACFLMGWFARLPIALAPGMGQNFFFVSVIMSLGGASLPGEPWRQALAIVLVAGIVFLALTLVGLRQVVLDVMSPSLRSAIAVGIGLFIAFIGLKNGQVLRMDADLISLRADALMTPSALVFWSGLLSTCVLRVWRVPGSLLIGICVGALVAFSQGELQITQVFGWPEFSQSAVGQFDFGAVASRLGLTFIAVFVFMDIFDTTGTLLAVGHQAELMQDGKLPQLREAMLADSLGTVLGACLGTSTVTSYIESAAGVEQGGRTGLTAITVGLLFLAAIGTSPLIIALGGYGPITAPALVVVGAMMFRGVLTIDWKDDCELLPAFLVILGIPLFFSIADGIAVGLVLAPLLKLARGRWRETSVAGLALAAMLLAYFLLVRVQLP